MEATNPSAVTITGPSPSLWTTSMPCRVRIDRSNPDRYAYFTKEEHAVAYLNRNWYLPRVIEVSPRMALGGEPHGADEPSPEPWVGPTPGTIETCDLNGPGGAGTELT